MLKDPDKDLVSVNKILGRQASIGFIPAEQIIPWLVLVAFSYTITNGLFSLGIPCFLIVNSIKELKNFGFWIFPCLKDRGLLIKELKNFGLMIIRFNYFGFSPA